MPNSKESGSAGQSILLTMLPGLQQRKRRAERRRRKENDDENDNDDNNNHEVKS
jgi:hypothetical protein